MASIKVIKPGIATYVEDSGRYGYYHLGIPPGGALDQMSYKAGNLVGQHFQRVPVALLVRLARPHAEVALVGDEIGQRGERVEQVRIPAGALAGRTDPARRSGERQDLTTKHCFSPFRRGSPSRMVCLVCAHPSAQMFVRA